MPIENLHPFTNRIITEIAIAANETLPMTIPEVIFSVRLRVVQTTIALPHWELTLVDKTLGSILRTQENWDG